MMHLIEVDIREEARKAIVNHAEKYHWIYEPVMALSQSERFVDMVTQVQVRVIGGRWSDHLDAALEESVHWCLGVVEHLEATNPELAREMLWGAR